MTSRAIVLLACATALASSLTAGFPAAVGQGTGPAQPPPGGGAQPGAPARREVEAAAAVCFLKPSRTTSTGFVPIFDGKTLNGWDGDPRFWRVENGEIVGETTPEKVVTQNNFLIWRGGTVRDFELKVEFRMNGTNSGIQYRSTELPDVGKWVLKGYQADIDFAGGVPRQRPRRTRPRARPAGARRLVETRAGDARRRRAQYKVVGTIGDSTLLRGVMNVTGWNQYHIIARGPVLMQLINGQLMAVALDEDAKHFTAEGLVGFQMHVGPPFKIQYRNVLLRKL